MADDLSLQGLLAQFQPTQADQDAARRQAMSQFFLGLLGAPRGQEASRIGQSGLLAMQGYQNALKTSQQAAMEKMQAASAAMQLKNAMQQFQDTQGARQVLQDYYKNQGLPSGPVQAQPAPAGAMDMTGSAGTGLPGAPAMPAPQPAMPQQGMPQSAPMPGQGVPPKAALYKQYEDMAQAMAAKGLVVQAQQYADMAQKYRPKIFKTEEGTDPTTGQRVQINYFDDGTHEILRDVGPAKKEAKIVDNGGQIIAGDPFTLQPIPGGGIYNKTMTPGEVASNQIAQGNLGVAQSRLGIDRERLGIERQNQDIRRVEVDPMGILGLNKNGIAVGGGAPTNVDFASTLSPQERQAAMADAQKSGYLQPSGAPAAVASGLHGDEFLKTLPPSVAAQVKALADGNMAFPTGYALRSPMIQGLIQLVSQYDPNFDAVNYTARAATRKAFTSGTPATSIAAMNTVMGHLEDLSKSADALHNTSFPMLNSVVNTVGGQVSPDLKGRLNAFNTQLQAVASELERVYRGTGGSTRDIDEWRRNLSNSDSPEAIKASIRAGLSLIKSRMDALGDQYNKGMGTTADGLTLLSPKAQAAFNRLAGEQQPGGSNIDELVRKYAR